MQAVILVKTPPALAQSTDFRVALASLCSLKGQVAGFAKTFCPLLVILSGKAGVLRQTFWVFVSHFTLTMAGKYDYFAGHFV